MTEVADPLETTRPHRFRRYPEYKESGVDWLREVPAHWQMKRLKAIAAVQLSNVDKHSEEGEVPVKLCNYVDVYYNDFITAELDFMNATATPGQARRFRLRVGDVVITKDSESWTDIAVPAVVAEELPDVLCGYHLAQIRPAAGLDGRFLARQFGAVGARDQFRVAANGITRFGLGGDAIRGSVFAVPPINEQRAIADFLDRETATIDALVARKERLIELLQEKRTALITRTVTRGLDPNVPMKDSGVEWLGDIPAHWDSESLSRQLVRITYGFTNPMPVADEGPYMLTALDIGDGQILYENARRTTEAAFRHELTDKSRPRAGDLLLTKDGTQGRVAMADGQRVSINRSIALLRFVPSVHVNFMQHLLRAAPYQDRMAFEAGGTAIKHIYISRLARMPVVIPPREEQQLIASFLDREKARIAVLIGRVQDAIGLLQEFRAALVAAAVTGRVDVRKAVPR